MRGLGGNIRGSVCGRFDLTVLCLLLFDGHAIAVKVTDGVGLLPCPEGLQLIAVLRCLENMVKGHYKVLFLLRYHIEQHRKQSLLRLQNGKVKVFQTKKADVKKCGRNIMVRGVRATTRMAVVDTIGGVSLFLPSAEDFRHGRNIIVEGTGSILGEAVKVADIYTGFIPGGAKQTAGLRSIAANVLSEVIEDLTRYIDSRFINCCADFFLIVLDKSYKCADYIAGKAVNAFNSGSNTLQKINMHIAVPLN